MKNITYTLGLFVLFLMSCSNDDDKPTTDPLKLWNKWELAQATIEVQTSSNEVTTYINKELEEFFQTGGRYAQLEFTNEFKLTAPLYVINELPYERSYKLLNEIITIYRPSNKELAQSDLPQKWQMTFFVQNSKLYLSLKDAGFIDLKECIKNQNQALNDEKIEILLEQTNITSFEVALVYTEK